MFVMTIIDKEHQEDFFFENKEDAEKAEKIASEDYYTSVRPVEVISLEDFKDYYKNFC